MPSQRRDMALRAAKDGGTTVAHTYSAFDGQTSHRYHAMVSERSVIIADWLTRVSGAYRDCGFRPRFIHLRIQGYGVESQARESLRSELVRSPRIKPRKSIVC